MTTSIPSKLLNGAVNLSLRATLVAAVVIFHPRQSSSMIVKNVLVSLSIKEKRLYMSLCDFKRAIVYTPPESSQTQHRPPHPTESTVFFPEVFQSPRPPPTAAPKARSLSTLHTRAKEEPKRPAFLSTDCDSWTVLAARGAVAGTGRAFTPRTDPKLDAIKEENEQDSSTSISINTASSNTLIKSDISPDTSSSQASVVQVASGVKITKEIKLAPPATNEVAPDFVQAASDCSQNQQPTSIKRVVQAPQIVVTPPTVETFHTKAKTPQPLKSVAADVKRKDSAKQHESTSLGAPVANTQAAPRPRKKSGSIRMTPRSTQATSNPSPPPVEVTPAPPVTNPFANFPPGHYAVPGSTASVLFIPATSASPVFVRAQPLQKNAKLRRPKMEDAPKELFRQTNKVADTLEWRFRQPLKVRRPSSLRFCETKEWNETTTSSETSSASSRSSSPLSSPPSSVCSDGESPPSSPNPVSTASTDGRGKTLANHSFTSPATPSPPAPCPSTDDVFARLECEEAENEKAKNLISAKDRLRSKMRCL